MTRNIKSTTREQIILKSARLFSQRGYFGVSMQDIADKTGVTKAALYYHFPGKEKLYQEILEKTFYDLSVILKKSIKEGPTPFDVLFNVIENYLLFSLKRPEIRLFFKEDFPSDKSIVRCINQTRKKLLLFFQKLIQTESFGRKLASRQLVFTASIIVTLVEKSLLLASLSPKIITQQILGLIGQKPLKKPVGKKLLTYSLP